MEDRIVEKKEGLHADRESKKWRRELCILERSMPEQVRLLREFSRYYEGTGGMGAAESSDKNKREAKNTKNNEKIDSTEKIATCELEKGEGLPWRLQGEWTDEWKGERLGSPNIDSGA